MIAIPNAQSDTITFIVENVFPDRDFDKEIDRFMENIGRVLISLDKEKNNSFLTQRVD